MQADDLGEVKILLDRIWHRNKNQHRTQKWWKWLGMLRRAVRDLIDLEAGDEKTGQTAEEVREQLAEARVRSGRREMVEERVREVLLPGCWRAFSTVVADVQFGALGVVLIGEVARVGRCVGLPKESVNEVTATSLRVMGADHGEVVTRVQGGEDLGVLVGSGREEDVGQAIERGDEMAMKGRDEDQVKERGRIPEERVRKPEATSAVDTGSSRVPRKKGKGKKKRKEGNAIDEIFAGF